MRIAIDARMMGAEQTRGIGRYIEELIRALLALPGDERYLLIAKAPHPEFQNNPRVQMQILDIPWYGWKEQFELPKHLLAAQIDLVHFPHWNVPLAYRKPFVVTVHDLLLRHRPNSAKTSMRSRPMRLLKQRGYRLSLDHAVKHAKGICVPTEIVKRDIQSFYPDAEDKIIVTGEGMTRLPDPRPGRPLYPYLLYVGSAYPHKRLDLILAAWSKLQFQFPEVHMVFAGEEDRFMKRIESSAGSMEMERVHFYGRVTDQQLANLYAGAAAFVFSSEFEGFGHPPLEALMYGCPVVCSEKPPMTEVLGRTGVIYFKTGAVDDMIHAVKVVVDNLDSWRNQAKNAGRQLRERHTWKLAAERTLAVYRQGGTESPR